MPRRAALVLAGLVLIAAAPAAADTRRVSIHDFYFSPVPRSAQAGDVIRFKWVDEEYPHTVKFKEVPEGADTPRSCTVRTAGTCKRTLKKPGVYRYICTIHYKSKGMAGRIKVARAASVRAADAPAVWPRRSA